SLSRLSAKKEPRLSSRFCCIARPAIPIAAAGSNLKKCRGLKKEGGNLLRGVPPTKKAPTLVSAGALIGSFRLSDRLGQQASMGNSSPIHNFFKPSSVNFFYNSRSFSV